MTSELATYQPTLAVSREVTLTNYQDAAVQRLGDWAVSADAAYQVAERLATSSFVPAQFKGKPVELTAAILAGIEVGLSPMTAMRSFDIISGQAAPRAITLRAIVQSYGHEIVLVESTNTRCRMKGKRRGSDEWQSVTWTMDRARDLGLVGKDNWKKQPAAMLVARATSELARLIASDAILGIGYSSEEIADGGSFEQVTASDTVAEVAPIGTRKMSRASRIAESEVVDVDLPGDYDEPDETPEESPLLNTRGPLAKRMFASLNEVGIGDDERIDFCSATIGRTITSSKEMTDADAQMVIEAAQALKAAEQPADDPTISPEWGSQS